MRVRSRLRQRFAAVETLEPRMLLSATVIQPIPNVTLTQNTPQTLDLSGNFDDPTLGGTLVQIQTTVGAITVLLDDSVAPLTVANFLNYTDAGLYNGTIIHRVVNQDPPNEFRIMQGGGFDPNGNPIPTPFGAVQNEFHLSNLRGTIAMAKLANDPNSATSQWFINDSDNTFLDSSDGGFTVFGQVVGGMSVVDQITQLETVDGTALNPQFDNSLPVELPVAAGQTPTPADLVQVETVSVLPKVSLVVSNQNPAIVTATLSGTSLTLTPVANAFGFAFVSVRANDLSGHAVSDTFRVEVDPTGALALDVPIGGGNAHSIHFTDSDHSTGIIQLSGPGSGVIHFGGDGISLRGGHVRGANVTAMQIDLSGTTAASTLTIIGRGGKDHAIALGGIDDSGALGSTRIIRSVIQSDVTIARGVGTFRCDFAHSGTLDLGTPLAGHSLQILANAYFDENVITTASIKQIRSLNWYGTDNVSESVKAPLLRKLIAFGNFTPGIQLTGAPGVAALGHRVLVRGVIGGKWTIPGGVTSLKVGGVALDFDGNFPTPMRSFVVIGDFEGSLTVPSIGTLTVKNQMIDAALTFTAPSRDLGTLSVRRGVSATLIDAAGSIGAINTKSIVNSNIYAGVNPSSGSTNLPANVADVTAANLAAHASIGSITLDTAGETTYLNSNIIASNVGFLTLGATATINDGTPFGIATATLSHLDVRDKSKHQSFVFTNIHDAATLATLVQARGLTLTDLAINIV